MARLLVKDTLELEEGEIPDELPPDTLQHLEAVLAAPANAASVASFAEFLKCRVDAIEQSADLLVALRTALLKVSQDEGRSENQADSSASSAYCAFYTILFSLAQSRKALNRIVSDMRLGKRLKLLQTRVTPPSQHKPQLKSPVKPSFEEWWRLPLSTIGEPRKLSDYSSIKEAIKRLRLKKLMLVLDLDQTLVHTIPYTALQPEYSVLGAYDHENIVALRPGVLEFLQTVSQFCDCHIFTHGAKPYAMQIRKLIDPHGEFFKTMLAPSSRENVGKKSVEVFSQVYKFPVDKNLLLILDDQLLVWEEDQSDLYG